MKAKTKMTPELIRKWVHALESGKYKQGRGDLIVGCPHSGNMRHCCLGVLGSVAGLSRRRLSQEVRLTEILPHLLDEMVETAFVRMNDEVRMSFHEIASVIRQGCPEVFEDEDEEDEA